MAELATIARPYAEALFKAVGAADALAVAEQVAELAKVAGDSQLRQFADSPKTQPEQVFTLVTSVVKVALADAAKNLLRTVIDNGRLAAMPEIAAQFHSLVNARSGVSDATVYSAFPIDAAQLPGVVASLEKRFGRKIKPQVSVDNALIGGVTVRVGDEVIDASVRGQLAAMDTALRN